MFSRSPECLAVGQNAKFASLSPPNLKGEGRISTEKTADYRDYRKNTLPSIRLRRAVRANPSNVGDRGRLAGL